jgi:hypothetical protein
MKAWANRSSHLLPPSSRSNDLMLSGECVRMIRFGMRLELLLKRALKSTLSKSSSHT